MTGQPDHGNPARARAKALMIFYSSFYRGIIVIASRTGVPEPDREAVGHGGRRVGDLVPGGGEPAAHRGLQEKEPLHMDSFGAALPKRSINC